MKSRLVSLWDVRALPSTHVLSIRGGRQPCTVRKSVHVLIRVLPIATSTLYRHRQLGTIARPSTSLLNFLLRANHRVNPGPSGSSENRIFFFGKPQKFRFFSLFFFFCSEKMSFIPFLHAVYSGVFNAVTCRAHRARTERLT